MREEMKLNIPEIKCDIRVFVNDDFHIKLTHWPHWWRRFWYWLFFGWQFRRINNV